MNLAKRIQKSKRVMDAVTNLTPKEPTTRLDDTIDGEVVCIEVVSEWSGSEMTKIKLTAVANCHGKG